MMLFKKRRAIGKLINLNFSEVEMIKKNIPLSWGYECICTKDSQFILSRRYTLKLYRKERDDY